MENKPIVLERTFNVPADKVWSAITNKNEMKSWFFNLEDFRPEVGFRFQFTGGPSPEKQYLHLCEITEVVPGKLLTYSWRYEGYDGNSFVTFELTDMGDHTLLRLTHAGLDTFPKENPDLDKNNFVQGWDEIINTSLKNYLEK